MLKLIKSILRWISQPHYYFVEIKTKEITIGKPHGTTKDYYLDIYGEAALKDLIAQKVNPDFVLQGIQEVRIFEGIGYDSMKQDSNLSFSDFMDYCKKAAKKMQRGKGGKMSLEDKVAIFGVKYLRPIYANVFGFIFFLAYGLDWLLSKKARLTYSTNKKEWESIKTLDQLNNWFKTIYKYKYDGQEIGLKGEVDHNNFKLEFYISYGDCDDVARYAWKKLSGIGYKCYPLFFYGNGIKNFHFDTCFFDGSNYYMFCFGDNIKGKSVDDCAAKLCKAYGWKNVDYLLLNQI